MMKVFVALVVTFLSLTLAIPMDAAEAGSVSVTNCRKDKRLYHSYNSNDSVFLVPFATICLDPGKSGTIRCATSKCILKSQVAGFQCIGSHVLAGGKTGPISGQYRDGC